MDLQRNIQKKLLEKKQIKEISLIKESIISHRLGIILESIQGYDSIEDIPLKQRKKITASLFREFHILHQTNLITEAESGGLWGFLQSIFGNVGFGVVEGLIVEPFVNSILSKLGLGGFFKKFLVSFLSTNPMKVIEAFKDCKTMTKLISEALAEATFMMIQESVGAGGFGYDVIRNVLGKAVKETSFISELENKFADTICSGFDSLVKNAKGVKDKLSELKPDTTDVTKNLSSGVNDITNKIGNVLNPSSTVQST